MSLAALRKVHAWAGLGLCILLFPITLSGAALVFKPQWMRLITPAAGSGTSPTPQDAALALAAATAAFERPSRVIFASPAFGVHEVIAADGGGYLAPDTGKIVSRWDRNERAVDWLFDLHHHLFSGKAGTLLTGYVGLATALMLVTGMLIWLPAWRSFRGRVAPAAPRRAGWLSAHRDLGVMSAPIALILVLSGSALALSDLSARLMGFQRQAPPAASPGEVDWLRALTEARTLFPDAELRMAIPPSGPGKPASVRLRQPAEWHANGRTIVYIDPASSRVLAVDDAMEQSLSARLFNAFWPVHAARVGGPIWQLLSFLTGAGIATVAAYGVESYRRRLFPPSSKPDPWSVVDGSAADSSEAR